MADSTSSVSGASSLSSINGIGGLATGIDTDTLVQSLTSTEQTKIDKQNQQLQKLQWQQEAYRDIITKMQSFSSKYLDSTSKTDLTRSSSFNTISASVSGKAVSVITNTESYAGKFTVNSVESLATGRSVKTGTVSGKIAGTEDLMSLINSDDYSDSENLDSTVIGKLAGKSLSFTLDGTTKVISFDESFAESFYSAMSSGQDADEAFLTAMDAKLDTAFGDGRIEVSFSAEGGLKFDTDSSSGLSIYAVNEDMAPLETLGIENGSSNKISLNKQLSSMGNIFASPLTGGTTVNEGTEEEPADVTSYAFKINGVEFTAKSTESLRNVMNRINNSTAGVSITYSEVTDTFTMTSKATGTGSELNFEDTDGNFLEALGFAREDATVTAGSNARFTIDGVAVERDTNTNISINGVYITLQETTDEATEVEMKSDTSSLKDMIVGFVNDYNEMIEAINKARTEEKNKDYAPLTDAQKEEMSDKQIEKWEEKAKAGILRNDSTLNTISSKLSTLMYTKFNGFSLYEMGIQSAGYSENGKLTIDEDKLDAVLSTKESQVKDFFLGDTGFGAALENTMNSAIKTSGPQGKRGSLIERAGIGNTQSDTQNMITDQIKSIKEYIETLQSRLEDRQQYWWRKFSSLETLVSNMNAYSGIIGAYTSN